MVNSKRKTYTLHYASYFILIVFIAIVASATAFATDDFYKKNDINFIDPAEPAPKICTIPEENPATEKNLFLTGTTKTTSISNISSDEAKIWGYLTGENFGLSKEQAAAVMGVMNQQSELKPSFTVRDPKQDSVVEKYGLVAWESKYLPVLDAQAKKLNVDKGDIGLQLGYLREQLNSEIWNNRTFVVTGGSKDLPSLVDNISDATKNSNNGGASPAKLTKLDGLKNQTTLEKAVIQFYTSINPDLEKNPNTRELKIDNDTLDKMIVSSKKYLESESTYKKLISSAPSRTEGCITPENATAAINQANLIKYVQKYVLPEYHKPVYPPTVIKFAPTPDYQAIALKLKNAGLYHVGASSGPYKGIDCGGFVGILMTQSGYEPEYNFRIELARGASTTTRSQYPWLKKNWRSLGFGGKINPTDLRPGDVAIKNGHTYLFIGRVPGIEGTYASASLSRRAPMSGGPSESVTNPNFEWFRKPNSETSSVLDTKQIIDDLDSLTKKDDASKSADKNNNGTKVKTANKPKSTNNSSDNSSDWYSNDYSSGWDNSDYSGGWYSNDYSSTSNQGVDSLRYYAMDPAAKNPSLPSETSWANSVREQAMSSAQAVLKASTNLMRKNLVNIF